MTANILNIVCGLVCVVIVCVNAAPSAKLPKGFILCKKSDPKFDECIKTGIQSAVPHLAKGVPSMGINKMDPLRISTLLIDQGKGPVSIKLDFKDLDISNLKSIIIDKIHYNAETYSLDVELHPEKSIILDGDYEITGKVLILPIVGKGKCKIVIDVSKLVGTVQMKPVVKNGNKYLEIVNIAWKFTPTNMKIKLDNLFNGDKALGDNMNLFLNENWRELLNELQPAIEEVFGKAFGQIAQSFLSRFPENQVILDHSHIQATGFSFTKSILQTCRSKSYNMNAFIVKFVCCLVYIFVETSHAAPPTKLPKGFIQCKLSDPALNECIRDALQRATPYLAKGIPSLGLLPTDPLRINSLGIDQGIGAVNLKFRDLDILNMKSTIIKNLTYDPKNYTLNVALVVQKPIVLEGQYETNGRVIILPINGNGTCRFALDNYKSFSVIKMKPVLINGNTHLEIKSLDWKFTTSKMHLKMNNLFNGDKLLGDNMNLFLNENWMELLKEMQPAFEKALSSAFISIAQEFFNRIPLNQIFID
ncbi:uncharacterized protein LOC132946731 [Metopolophium dirhodum]|uniref:uncharacterized protein LOC132946731 n=1 Tax=Metopolophium dirhodum TaxID=44670 RepID=UPI00298FBF22|nr:uncharacterized protein LOC132946731 [Metopolophium dirhodum]